jgi:hypothetical protein
MPNHQFEEDNWGRITIQDKRRVLMTNGRNYDQPASYVIRIQGMLDLAWSDWFGGFTITQQNGETLLVGQVTDQSALHGILAKINDLGLPIISVERRTT